MHATFDVEDRGLQYVGSSKIEGPLVVVERIRDVGYDEIVEILDSAGRPRLGGSSNVPAVMAARHSCTWESYSRSRRSTAPFVPFGAASYSATIRRLYSVVNVRRFARPARGPSAAGVDAVGLVVVVVSSEPTSAVVVVMDLLLLSPPQSSSAQPGRLTPVCRIGPG